VGGGHHEVDVEFCAIEDKKPSCC